MYSANTALKQAVNKVSSGLVRLLLEAGVEDKLIRKAQITDASVHDLQVLDLDNSGSEVWADSAYRLEETETWLVDQGYWSRIHHRAYRNQALKARQREQNHRKSKIMLNNLGVCAAES